MISIESNLTALSSSHCRAVRLLTVIMAREPIEASQPLSALRPQRELSDEQASHQKSGGKT